MCIFISSLSFSVNLLADGLWLNRFIATKGEDDGTPIFSITFNNLGIYFQNLAHCIFVMKYWVVSKKIEFGMQQQLITASFENRIKLAMTCLSILYFVVVIIAVICIINNRRVELFAWLLDIPVLIAIPYLASAFWRLQKLTGKL